MAASDSALPKPMWIRPDRVNRGQSGLALGQGYGRSLTTIFRWSNHMPWTQPAQRQRPGRVDHASMSICFPPSAQRASSFFLITPLGTTDTAYKILAGELCLVRGHGTWTPLAFQGRMTYCLIKMGRHMPAGLAFCGRISSRFCYSGSRK